MSELIVITDVTGEGAPKWLKEAWRGCVLPFEEFEDNGPTSVRPLIVGHVFEIEGELISPRQVKVSGYFVRQDKALQVLAKKAPYAMQWYRDESCPQPNGYFLIQHKDAKLFEASVALVTS